jgi:hypothetical protein
LHTKFDTSVFKSMLVCFNIQTLNWRCSECYERYIFQSIKNDNEYVPLVVNTSRFFPHSRLITGFVTRLTRRVPLVEQELLTLPEHLSSPPVRVTRSLFVYVCFVDRCLTFCIFSFGHCVVCSSSIYGFWLRLWYLQTFLITISKSEKNRHYVPYNVGWSTDLS